MLAALVFAVWIVLLVVTARVHRLVDWPWIVLTLPVWFVPVFLGALLVFVVSLGAEMIGGAGAPGYRHDARFTKYRKSA